MHHKVDIWTEWNIADSLKENHFIPSIQGTFSFVEMSCRWRREKKETSYAAGENTSLNAVEKELCKSIERRFLFWERSTCHGSVKCALIYL